MKEKMIIEVQPMNEVDSLNKLVKINDTNLKKLDKLLIDPLDEVTRNVHFKPKEKGEDSCSLRLLQIIYIKIKRLKSE